MSPASPTLRFRRRGCAGAGLFALALLAGGCAHAPQNLPLAAGGPAADYRYPVGARPAGRSGLMAALFFSGGGTRAAALSYGVLRELAATPLPGGGRMLDDVTTINAVSGGSFTAAYYCLYGDRIFADYEQLFLKRNVQDILVARCLTPVNTVRLWSSRFGRSDLAAEYYDELLFHGATFGDLARLGPDRPYLVINATNIATGASLQFTQQQFDQIGSDLSRFPIARAVAASSAVPLLFSPIILKNYADRVPPAGAIAPPPAEAPDIFASFRDALAETSRTYRDVENHPYIDLMDGGLSDNLALRNLLNQVTLAGGWDAVLGRLRGQGITKLAIVVVNAAVEGEQPWARDDRAPGLKAVVSSLSNSSIIRANRETLAMVETSLALWQRERAARGPAAGTPPKVYFIRVDLRSAADPAERAFFESVPTRFHLPPATVDRLVQGGRLLLRESPEFQRLLRDLEADRPRMTAEVGATKEKE